MTSETETPRRRLSADDRRACILHAARTLFARRGYQGAGTAEIAAAAGCSEAIIYRHFASKQALFAAVLDDASAAVGGHIRELVAGADDPLARIAGCVERLAQDELVVEVTRLRMLAVTLADEPEIRAALARSVGQMREHVERFARSMQSEGGYRTDVSPEQVAWLWLGVVLATGFRLALDGPAAVSEVGSTTAAFMRLIRTGEEST